MAMILTLTTLGASAMSKESTMHQSELRQDGIIYTVFRADKVEDYADNYAVVSGNYLTEQTDVVIPECVTQGTLSYTVTKIGDKAFYHDNYLEQQIMTSVTIPNTVTSIGEGAFSYNTRMVSANLPEGLTFLGKSAFSYCERLESDIVIPKGITRIEDEIFKDCRAIPSVTFHDAIDQIGAFAFENCESITQIEIPKSVTIIGNCAFAHINAETIELPNTITSIGAGAFRLNKSLKSINIPESIPWIEGNVFEWCTVLEHIELPNTLLRIGPWAFLGSGLKSIEIPNSVNVIGESAFQYCHDLVSVEMSKSVSTIGSEAFYYCESLTEIDLPPHLKNIGYATFSKCKLLSSVSIPEEVTTIGEFAFSDSGISTLSIPGSVTSIGDKAFKGCNKLRTINYNTTKPVCAKKSIFDDLNYVRATLYVAEGGLDNAYDTEPWGFFYHIEEKDFSGVDEVITELDSQKPVEIFTLQGGRSNAEIDSLPSGIYIIRQGSLIKKIAVK